MYNIEQFHAYKRQTRKLSNSENFMVSFFLWVILLMISWPVAIIALILYPIIWLLLLPFKLIGITVSAVFELLKSIITLPSRVLKGPSTVR